jgi:hypothetical protein
MLSEFIIELIFCCNTLTLWEIGLDILLCIITGIAHLCFAFFASVMDSSRLMTPLELELWRLRLSFGPRHILDKLVETSNALLDRPEIHVQLTQVWISF